MHYQAAYETAAHAEPLPWIKASKAASSWQGAFWSWRTLCFLPTDVWHHHRDSCLTQASDVPLPERASWRGTNTPAALLQKPSWWLRSLNRAGWPCESTWWCGSGRRAVSSTNCPLPYIYCRTVSPKTSASSSYPSSCETESCCYLAAIWSLPWSWLSPWAIITAS